MEDTLREIVKVDIFTITGCLNPCFNGRYSQRNFGCQYYRPEARLNPCFNGRYSQRMFKRHIVWKE